MSGLDANDVIRHLREQISVDYGRTTTEAAILRTEVEALRKILMDTVKAVNNGLAGPEDSHTLVLKQLEETLANWNQ